MSKAGVPIEQSLTKRIQRFYRDNPSEWLSWEDIETKFDCTKAQAINAIAALRSCASLEVVSVVRVKPEDAQP